MKKRTAIFGVSVLVLAVFSGATLSCLQPVDDLHSVIGETVNTQVTDRNGIPLSVTYQGKWNTSDIVPLYDIPQSLKDDFLLSEDRNFYKHRGIDWSARAAALWQNIRARRIVRGASTIDEQVIRLLHPRPRTLWSKWLEGIEAMRLDAHNDKNDILEFYLNQVPYSANRRGVAQAAHYYFDRDLSTLNRKETAALAVLARAPSDLDLYRNPKILDKRITALFAKSDTPDAPRIIDEDFSLAKPAAPVEASHFIRFVRQSGDADKQLHTTLDSSLQNRLQNIFDQRLQGLQNKHTFNGALLVADHTTGEILAWVVAGARSGNTTHPTPGWNIDAVTAPRQPGSSMKPLLYAAALDKGWTAATLIDDSPLSEAVGNGLHRFRNYSRHFYGPLPLREALGNSLNIPALKTIRYVGVGNYLTLLHEAGFTTLNLTSGIYDEGLALGNAEVTLHDMVQAYAALAHRGVYRPLHFLQDGRIPEEEKRLYSDETAGLIGNILSDPYARRYEFGTNSVLNLPVQTAVKTGTSNDYHDAWALGYNDRYVVGAWIGNLDRSPMNGVTGSTGPALVLRAAFAELNKFRETRPLYLSPKLEQHRICIQSANGCVPRTEYFLPGTAPQETILSAAATPAHEMIRPTRNLQIAYDPRIPTDKQRFRFELSRLTPGETVEWIVNGETVAVTPDRQYLWPLARGRYTLETVIHGAETTRLPTVPFRVK